jgi:transposase
MTCPKCLASTRVIDTIQRKGVTYRRRRCAAGHRYNTAERVTRKPIPWCRVEPVPRPPKPSKVPPIDWVERISAKILS